LNISFVSGLALKRYCKTSENHQSDGFGCNFVACSVKSSGTAVEKMDEKWMKMEENG
jgi:hypothetical protein